MLLGAATACGGGSSSGPLVYDNPSEASAKLALVQNKASTPTKLVLDLVVVNNPITGYSTGFDLPLDDTKVALGPFTPGTALSPGSAPQAAQAVLPATGPLAHNLVVAQSQKATGTGAVASDTMLPAGTVLLTVELDYVANAPAGVVFDGTAAGFTLPSGGLLDRTGNGVAGPTDVAIGKLEVVK
jgi:hypothetical protein